MGSGRFGGSRVTGFGKGWQCGDVGRGSALASGFGLQRGYRQANGTQTCGLRGGVALVRSLLLLSSLIPCSFSELGYVAFLMIW